MECIKAAPPRLACGRYGGAVTPNRGIDADFLDLPRHELADAALSAATAAGASYADLRIHRISTEIIQLRDGELETAVVSREIGLAVRVIVDGTWGFASHAELAPAVAAETARRAVQVATTLAALNAERVELAAEPVYADATWVSNYRIDPFDIPAADKIAVLEEYSGRLLSADGIDHVSAGLTAVKEQTFYADTFGSSITQQRVRVLPSLEAVTVDAAAGSFDSMRTLAPPMGRGWEALAGDEVWNWTDELAQLPSLLAEKVKAPSVTAGPHRPGDRPDQPVADHSRIHRPRHRIRPGDRLRGRLRRNLVRHPGQTRHHALRLAGDERDRRPHRRIRFGHHRLRRRGRGRAKLGSGARRDLRRLSARPGVRAAAGRSRAPTAARMPTRRITCRSSGWPTCRCSPAPTTLSTADLIGRVEDGIYIVGDKSWSIDMQRYNFQFTGQRFFRIRDGRLDGQLRDVAYQATTTDFWNSMEAVGGPSTWRLGGAFNCGKAQPGQVAAVSHGCPSALFRGVNVLNTRTEGGR